MATGDAVSPSAIMGRELRKLRADGLAQPPTQLRQVMALLLDPHLLANDGYGRYPPEVVASARRILALFSGSSVGSYTHTGGQLPVRVACADFFTRRDPGLACRVEDVFANCGSVEAIKLLLEGVGKRRPKPAGVLVPSPGCPLYEGLARQVGVAPTSYRLGGPELGWQLVEAELESAYQSALDAGSEPRLLVLINPGSPAGQLLSLASLRLAAEFARRRRLFVIADETLQFGAFDGAFVGFRRVAAAEGDARPLEVASLASLSKPGFSECGLRAGFCELLNLHPGVKATLVSVLACSSCPPVLGQAALVAALPSASAEAPVAGEDLRRRAALVKAIGGDALELLEPPRAGGHAYPRLRAPGAAAKRDSGLVDAVFCRELRERTGVVAVPGSAFGQWEPAAAAAGVGLFFYIRISIQKSDEDLRADVTRIVEFHRDFLRRYG